MRILFDQGTPVPLRGVLPGHTIETAYERGWDKLSNGDLSSVAESNGFDLFLTTDQNLSARRIAIFVLPTTRWPEIRQHISEVAAAVTAMMPNEF